MPREYVEKVKPIGLSEEIISYTYHIGTGISLYTGIGTVNEIGEFIPLLDQTYTFCAIEGEHLDNLLSATETKPQGVFRKDDLWEYIDTIREEEIQKQLQIAEKIARDALEKEATAKKAEEDFAEAVESVKFKQKP